MPVTQDSPAARLRVLADDTRLRILALLAQAELSVGEIARCLATGQSRVSNHLKLLREVGLIAERHEGSFTFCRLDVPDGPLGRLWEALSPSLDERGDRQADEARLAVVLADRADSRAFFDRIADDWDTIGSRFLHGTSRLEVVTRLVPRDLVVADIGCGTGYLGAALGRRVRRVVAVDSSAAMLERARAKLEPLGVTLDPRPGSLEALPLGDGEVDAACAHLVLHHLADTRVGVTEMARVVRPGGLVVAVDMLPHHETWMHEAMADTRLGLDPSTLVTDFRAAGLEDVEHEILDDRYVVERPSGRPVQLPLHLVTGRRPGDPSTDRNTAPPDPENPS